MTAEPTEWPSQPDRPPRAGVSAFGWSGTNAHIVLEGYRSVAADAGPDDSRWPAGPARPVAVRLTAAAADAPVAEALSARPARLLPLSARSAQALRESAPGLPVVARRARRR